MADSSLDVFFAKKDKSKKSKSRKFAAGTDSIGKSSDDGGKMSERAKRDKEKVNNSSSGSATNSQTPIQDDDEWNDVEEKETDYTGLKIQNVQISDQRDEDQERAKLEEQQDDEQSRHKDILGPWNRGGGGGGAVVVEPTVVEPPPPGTFTVVEEVSKKETKYIPPSMREGATPLPTLSRTKAKVAPQLASEFDFPSLSASDVKDAKAAAPKKVETSGRSEASNMRRPYAELASKSEMNQIESS